MGVEFFPCRGGCGEVICDAGDWLDCPCGKRFCGEDCAAWNEQNRTCRFCRMEEVTDDDLLNFLLRRFFLTRDRAVKLYRRHNGK